MTELTLFLPPQIQWIVTLIVIDVILGIIGALTKKNFRLGKVANFMVKPVLGYLFGFIVLANIAQAFVVNTAFVLIVLALIGSILNNLGKVGLGLPAYLKKE